MLPMWSFPLIACLKPADSHYELRFVEVSQLLQCGCVTCCSWHYEMYIDVPLCHMTETLIYIAAVCC